MEKIKLNHGDFIVSKTEDIEMVNFLRNGVANFFDELSQYINDNDDPEVLTYATERTLASLFVCGNLRREASMTGLQEYGTLCTKNNVEVHGRPDIFIKSGDKAIWIECKYQKNIQSLGTDHWDVPCWLAWDKENAFSQVEIYYNSEASKLNKSYKKRYIVTLCFKLIKENKEEHEKKVNSELKSKVAEDCDRVWYYQVGFFPGENGSQVGLEVYGTLSNDMAGLGKT